MTIYEALVRKLGREPTHKEMVADVRRILAEARCERVAAMRIEKLSRKRETPP